MEKAYTLGGLFKRDFENAQQKEIRIKRSEKGHICPKCESEGELEFDSHAGSIHCRKCGFDTFGYINVVLDK